MRIKIKITLQFHMQASCVRKFLLLSKNRIGGPPIKSNDCVIRNFSESMKLFDFLSFKKERNSD